jgi:arginyl-tRNA synthetase
MVVALDIRKELSDIVSQVAGGMELFGQAFEPDVRVADPRHGDYQCNGVLPHAKKLSCNPRQLGQQLQDGLNALPESSKLWSKIELAGPGFLNFTIRTDYLREWVRIYSDGARIAQDAASILAGRRVVVDFSSPNTAKQMHVGHIRSTVIGDAICRLLAFCGASVVRDNHIGDWGTQFGLLIMVIKRKGVDLEHLDGDRIENLESLYREGSQLAQSDPAAMDQARRELVLLQAGDSENFALWEHIVKVSYEEFEKIYRRLHVRFDVVLGESFYRDKVDRVYQELKEDGIAEESLGAWVVFHPEHPRFATQPFIIRKSDGASNYASTDLATALYRAEAFQADEVINITDARQRDHFEQLELTVRAWFARRGYRMPVMRHITFGTILGKDGKAIKTRSGGTVKLRELLDEAVERASVIAREKNPDIDESSLRQVSEAVGLASVRYADLSQNRSSDYQFDWDKMLAFEGNTAPYLLYVTARIHGIMRKLESLQVRDGEALGSLESVEELALAKMLSQFPMVLRYTLDDLRPHVLCTYLYELCGCFNSFYHSNTVIHEDLKIQNIRLLLCRTTLQILGRGLQLLGIEPLERM